MKLLLPLTITIPRKTKADKVFALNLNTFRTAHHFVMNNAKISYRNIVQTIWHNSFPYTTIPLELPLHFTYTIFPSSGRRFDLANVLAAVQKFTDDALVELGVIPDDNYKVIGAIDYRFGHIDKENPRAELEIFHWEEKP